MTDRLLDRQLKLLDYLTSSSAIFAGRRATRLDPVLRGLDRGLLRLEARFSYDKRMEKILSVFPKTFARLGAEERAIRQAFVDACPPIDISRLANARQFYDFLCERWQHEGPDPAYLSDVAACELACAQVRAAHAEGQEQGEGGELCGSHRRVRRRHDVVLLRCAHDVRPIFEDEAAQAMPVKRMTRVAVVPGAEDGEPAICELSSGLFDLVAALDDWTDVAMLGDTAEAIVAQLRDHALVELAR